MFHLRSLHFHAHIRVPRVSLRTKRSLHDCKPMTSHPALNEKDVTIRCVFAYAGFQNAKQKLASPAFWTAARKKKKTKKNEYETCFLHRQRHFQHSCQVKHEEKEADTTTTAARSKLTFESEAKQSKKHRGQRPSGHPFPGHEVRAI